MASFLSSESSPDDDDDDEDDDEDELEDGLCLSCVCFVFANRFARVVLLPVVPARFNASPLLTFMHRYTASCSMSGLLLRPHLKVVEFVVVSLLCGI